MGEMHDLYGARDDGESNPMEGDGDEPAFQDRATTLANHRRFVRRVVAAGEVWMLRTDDGWAACESTGDLDEEDDEPREVLPFWSDHAYAKRAATGEWAEYVPTAIPLDEFIGAWLKGMHEDGTLVGTNWDAPTGRIFGVQVKAREAPVHDLGEFDANDPTQVRSVADAPFPLCLFVFTMRDDHGYVAWLKAPASRARRVPALQSAAQTDWSALDADTLDGIVRFGRRYPGRDCDRRSTAGALSHR